MFGVSVVHKWLNRFLDYFVEVVRHFWTLLPGLLAGLLISLPGWLIPLLPKETAEQLQSWIRRERGHSSRGDTVYRRCDLAILRRSTQALLNCCGCESYAAN